MTDKEITDLSTELMAWVAARDMTPQTTLALFLRIVIRSSRDYGVPQSLVIGALKRGFHVERSLNGEH